MTAAPAPEFCDANRRGFDVDVVFVLLTLCVLLWFCGLCTVGVNTELSNKSLWFDKVYVCGGARGQDCGGITVNMT